MIFFRPTALSDNIIKLEAIENDVVTGECTLEISGTKAVISYIKCEVDGSFIVEGLIKSAFNYAASRNCYMGYYKAQDYSSILDKMSFIKTDGIYYNDIPSILMGSCCKKH